MNNNENSALNKPAVSYSFSKEELEKKSIEFYEFWYDRYGTSEIDEIEREALIHGFLGDTNNVYVRVSKVHEVDENVYIKIQKLVVNKGLLQYQHKDLSGTGWDEGEKILCITVCRYI